MNKIITPSKCPHHPTRIHDDGSIECLRCGFHVLYDENTIKTITDYPKGTKVLINAVIDKVEDEGTLKVTMPHVSSSGLPTSQVVVGLPVSCIEPKRNPKNKIHITYVVSLWEIHKDKWNHIDTYGTDMDGSPITSSGWAAGYDRECGCSTFLRSEGTEVLGRAATIWSEIDGVRLLDFNPPEWTPWIDWSSFKNLAKKNWLEVFEGAYGAKVESVAKARKLLEKYHETN